MVIGLIFTIFWAIGGYLTCKELERMYSGYRESLDWYSRKDLDAYIIMYGLIGSWIALYFLKRKDDND